MNADLKSKLAAGRAKARDEFRSQVIKVDENWTIRRVDQWNWEITEKGKFVGYYGDLLAAFRNLPRHMVSEEAKDSLQQVLDVVKGVKMRIRDALNEMQSKP